MHLRLLLPIFNESVMIVILNLFEPSSLKDISHLFSGEVIGSRLISPDVEVVLQLLVLSLGQSQLSQIVQAIVSEVEDSSFLELVSNLLSHLNKILW
jgi:hypothetical protein